MRRIRRGVPAERMKVGSDVLGHKSYRPKKADFYHIAGIGPKTRERLAIAGVLTIYDATNFVRRDGICELLKIMDIGPKRSRRVLRRTGLEVCPRCSTFIATPQLERAYHAIIEDRECSYLRRYNIRYAPVFEQAEEPTSLVTSHRGSRLQSVKSYLLGAGKDALVFSLIAGLTAVHPPAGVIAAKTYAVYSHGLAGFELYGIYTKWKSGGMSSPKAAGEAAKVITGEAMGGASNAFGASMVDRLGQTGMIDKLSKETNIGSGSISDMLQGTLSSSASEGFSDLEGYTVEKGTGA